MGWGNCGHDSQGRPIGYSFSATCDHPECSKEIDRGLAYVCGDMHGEDAYSCEKYYCERHKHFAFVEDKDNGINYWVCEECAKTFAEPDSGLDWDDIEGLYRPSTT